jgi:hypothetical protein
MLPFLSPKFQSPFSPPLSSPHGIYPVKAVNRANAILNEEAAMSLGGTTLAVNSVGSDRTSLHYQEAPGLVLWIKAALRWVGAGGVGAGAEFAG